MDSVNKTLYIPLYGKAYVSRRGLLLQDADAEAIWKQVGFPLKGKAKSKWLAYSMGMRSAVFDRWTKAAMEDQPDAIILHLGCGLDSRVHRLKATEKCWYDIDFSSVIAERKRYFAETGHYRMISADIRDCDWLYTVPGDAAIVVMEGISMYLTHAELQTFFYKLSSRFSRLSILMDSYTTFAAKATKYKNPINQVGVTQVYGFDDPTLPISETNVRFLREWALTPEDLIFALPRWEQGFFRAMFAGNFAKRIYRLYEYKKDTE